MDMKENFDYIRHKRTADQNADRPNVFLFFADPLFFKTILWLTRIWHIWFCPTPSPKQQNQKSQISQRSVWLLCMLTILSSTTICFAQNSQSLLIDKQVEMYVPANSADWDRINQMKMMRNNFPSLAPSYNQQIGQILEWYIEAFNPTNPSQDIARQQQKKAMQMMGQNPPPSQADIAAQQQRQLQGKPPELTPQEQRMTELKNLLNEVKTINTSMKKTGYYDQPAFKEDFKKYQNTLTTFKEILTTDQKNISLADAIYKSESAFGKLHLTYKEYKRNIAKSAAFISQWMRENNLSLTNPEAIHLAIQTFIGETMTIKDTNLLGFAAVPHSHKPFMYDYIDFRGTKDIHNYFLTKTLATGTGQCNTLPRVYLVLAEAMNVEVYLTFAPQHSFIKYRNNKGIIQNYEPTIHWHMTDQDYMEEMPMMSEATQNKLYLDTLNKKQIIASLVVDLAYNFMREHWLSDGNFMNECIDLGMSYFNNSEGLLLKNMLLASQLERTLATERITNLNEIENNPKALKVFNAFKENEATIEVLGIQSFPESKYQAMLEKHDKRGKLQAAKGIDTKSKRSLFYN
jgi:hypothetical protein